MKTQFEISLIRREPFRIRLENSSEARKEKPMIKAAQMDLEFFFEKLQDKLREKQLDSKAASGAQD